MKRKGYEFKLARHLTFRDAQARDLESDTYKGSRRYKDPSAYRAYAVIVPVRACINDEGEFDVEKREQAKALPFTGWSRTNMVYGAWRRQTRGRHFPIRTKPALTPAQYKVLEAAGDDNPEGWEQRWFEAYWTAPVYWIENGSVYTATRHTYEDPSS